MTKLIQKLIYIYFHDQADYCNSRFPGRPQAASLPVGHVTGGDLLAGHIP